MGTFVISKRFNGEYKFVFTSRKGKAIFSSLGYELKFECEEGIENFKLKMERCDYIKQKASNGKYFFKLMFDGDLFATSRKYSTELRLQNGIDEITHSAAKGEILDFTQDDLIFESFP